MIRKTDRIGPSTITFLGTGAALTYSGRYPGGVLLGPRILVDAPPQALSHLKKLGVAPEELGLIFITHFHPDHVLGLVTMAQEWLVRGNLPAPVPLVGPPGTRKFFTGLFDACFYRHSYDYTRLFTFMEMPGDGGRMEAGGVSFRGVPVKHSGPCLGYVIPLGDRQVAVSGDTSYCNGVRRLLELSDLSVLEMTFVDEDYPGHMRMIEDLALINRLRRPGQWLMLYHLARETSDVYHRLNQIDSLESARALEILNEPEVLIPEDLSSYEIF